LTVVEPALLDLLLLDWEDDVADAAGVVAVAEDPAVDERVTPANLQASWAVATAAAKSEAEQLCWKH